MTKTLFASAALLALLPAAHADISVSTTSFTYSESFDTLTTAVGNTTPWANDSTLLGWSLFNSTLAAITTYGADNGASNTGAFRSYGATGGADRALGGLASGGAYFGSPTAGNIAGWIGVSFTNNSGSTLDGFSFAYSGEQWRNGGATSPATSTAQTMVMEFGFGATFATVSGWTAPGGAADFTSPVFGTSTAAAVDGNVAGILSGRGGSFSNLAWAPGQTLWLRFVERNDSGNDHGLALDNFSIAVTPVPEPGAWTLMLAGLAALGFVARRRV